jgi:hypothetical protein
MLFSSLPHLLLPLLPLPLLPLPLLLLLLPPLLQVRAQGGQLMVAPLGDIPYVY